MAQGYEERKGRISLIAAISRADRGLGKDNDLLWRIPDDLKRFRDITRGHPVVMGRKTWESLPDAARPLPGRANVVVTRNASYEAPGATVCAALDEALEVAAAAEGGEEVFVIGGGELYAAALPRADRLYLTLIDAQKDADAFFPDYSAFTRVIEQEDGEHDGLRYSWVTLER